MEESTELVICVHGTFAAKTEDEGKDWWQSGSEFWHRLSSHLPAHIQQIPRPQTFHWSGKNSAIERRAAARRLLKLLQQLDESDQAYHLVGHSHGGSVIWDTLLLAASRRRRKKQGKDRDQGDPGLAGLLSWTTVGTPFIRSKASLSRIVLAFFSGTLTLTLLIALPVLVWNIGGLAKAQGVGIAVYMMLFFLFMFYASLGSTIAGLESQRADAENRNAVKILQSVGSRWLGIWHSADEAINGLRLSLALSGEIIPRRRQLFQAYAYPKLSMLFAPLSLITNPIFNLVLAPSGDRFVWKRVRNSATGNDRPGTFAREVEKAPLFNSDVLPNLPPRVEQALNDDADLATRAAAPKLRQLLARLSNGLGKGLAMEIQQSGLSGDELIHTSYFNDDDVVLLIAEQLSSHSRQPAKLELPEDLRDWREEFQTRLLEIVASQPGFLNAVFKALLILLALIAASYLAYFGYSMLSLA